MRKIYRQVIPQNLEPKINEIEQTPPQIPGFRMAYLKQIIYWICTRKDENGFTYLNMELLRKLIPQGEQYIHYLLALRLIQRTSSYQPEKHRSYGYRIAPEYDSEYMFRTVSDPRLITRINKVKRNFAHGFTAQNKALENLTIDPDAIEYVKLNYSGEKLNAALAAISMINNDDKYSLIDNAGGRYYSNVTNLKKELRQFGRVNGRPLIANIDIKNSQPYFSILLLTDPVRVSGYVKNKQFAMILKTLNISDNEDIKHYINLVTEGRFYEFLMPYFAERGLPSTRDDVKKVVMKILFDRNRERVSRSKRIFKRLFPTVYNIFSIVRGDGRGERFPILLQALEAYVVLKVILPRINREHPEIIAFTVHDSLLVTDSPDVVKAVMVEELERFTGFSPIVKIEFFGTSPTIEGEIRGEKRKKHEVLL